VRLSPNASTSGREGGAGAAGAGLLVITHDPVVAARAARTVHMADGKLTQ
jgi:predicted ABC-type transport system involved in lysophospholipase L1 biosynthesis ATPase subunit